MSKYQFALLAGAAALTAAVLATPALTQQQQQPPFATTKVEGTDGVYIFRNGGAQSMFIVTKDGVIATDPIGYQRPEGVTDYVNEIKKVTDKPIKDAGARVIAHKNAKAKLAQTNNPNVVMPDEVFDKSKTIKLGGTTLE